MSSSTSRRSFLKSIAITGLASPFFRIAPARAYGSNERINLAAIGVGGKGQSDLAETAAGQNVVAICDIDQARLRQAANKYPDAKTFTDWRELLELDGIDAVTISTPDHTHAPATMTAIRRGLHVYTQKPLTHDVYESRRLAEAAKEFGVVSQMGIQHHSSARLKNAVQCIRDGVIGKVSDVHTWTDRPGSFWKQGLERPDRTDAIPDSVHWDQWLGTAPRRPYVSGLYHPFHWRGWWDFGTGALGDMGCHIMDPVVNALELGPPNLVEAEGPPPHPDSGPTWCIVKYRFAGTAHTTEELKLTWYEAGKMPPRELFQAPDDWPGSKNGVLFIGSRGNLFVGFPEPPSLFPVGDFADYKMPDLPADNHYSQWTDAIRGQGETSCPFSYSGPLTETVLLGNVAYRSQEPVNWEAATMRTGSSEGSESFIRREYREGWGVEGLSSS